MWVRMLNNGNYKVVSDLTGHIFEAEQRECGIVIEASVLNEIADGSFEEPGLFMFYEGQYEVIADEAD